MEFRRVLCRSAPRRTLFACDPAKEEYRIWQCRSDNGTPTLTLRIEHHGAAPGWHVHSADGASPFLAERRAIPAAEFPPAADRPPPPFPPQPLDPDNGPHTHGTTATPVAANPPTPVPFPPAP